MQAELMMPRRELIEELDLQLARVLARYSAGDPATSMQMPSPSRLAAAAQNLTLKFVEGKPAEPPSQARINALDRLNRNDPRLNRRDWNLIAWGLCDTCGRAGKPIDSVDMISRVMDYLDEQSSGQGISRRFWFGLLHSYFAYASKDPSFNANWVNLRTRLAATASKLIDSQRRPKTWAKVLEAHSELLTPTAGMQLADAIFQGNTSIAAELKTYLPIPDSSWLWQRIISEQLLRLPRISDEAFFPLIPAMLQLAVQHPQETDNIIAALLTRYEKSTAREIAHEELKQLALMHWQNPQIKMANRWALVPEEVRKMVLHWFAMADLQHFFSLLQGAGGVDRDRLNYWLRFVDQIGYTRIVLGGDAIANQHPNYIDFRAKNKGRFSSLHGGDSANNAFIMRIGNYYFVEFSGKGNACYVYEEGRLPFSPASTSFTVLNLKHKNAATDRIIHNGSWQTGADWSLKRLGIFPSDKRKSRKIPDTPEARTTQPVFTLPSAPLPSESSRDQPTLPVENPVLPDQASSAGATSPFAALFSAPDNHKRGGPGIFVEPRPVEDSSVTRKDVHLQKASKISSAQAVLLAKKMVAKSEIGFADYRAHGGAFWILEKNQNSDLSRRLIELGFTYREGRGHWVT
jgi:hypothetical protein